MSAARVIPGDSRPASSLRRRPRCRRQLPTHPDPGGRLKRWCRRHAVVLSRGRGWSQPPSRDRLSVRLWPCGPPPSGAQVVQSVLRCPAPRLERTHVKPALRAERRIQSYSCARRVEFMLSPVSLQGAGFVPRIITLIRTIGAYPPVFRVESEVAELARDRGADSLTVPERRVGGLPWGETRRRRWVSRRASPATDVLRAGQLRESRERTCNK